MDDWYWYVAKPFLIYRFLLLRLTACMCILFSFVIGLVLIINKAEHHVLYQYHLVNAANHYMGLIQTETVSNNLLYI